MPTIEILLRRMDTGDAFAVELPDIAAAERWLAERPSRVEVVRVRTAIDEATHQRLRASARALDADEREVLRERDAAAEAADRAELERLQADAEAQRHGATASGAYVLVYEPGRALAHADAADARPIPADVAAAVQAFIAERNEWMHPRRQHVGGATLVVRVVDDGVDVEAQDVMAMPGFGD